MILDTDVASYRTASGAAFGIRPSKIVLSVGGGSVSTAGTVTITRPADSKTIYPPLIVAGSTAANTELYVDDPSSKAALNWNDFAVTGLTATKTVLYIWYNI